MSLNILLPFLLVTGFAAYLQTITGFAFGLVVMSAVGLSDLIPIPDAAVIVSLLTLVNALQVLVTGWRDVILRQVGIMLLTGVPMLLVGYFLLEHFADSNIAMLKIVLGVAIIGSSIQLLQKPKIGQVPSIWRAIFRGGLGGLMSGMFSTGGPPVVFHFYSQRLPLAAIRASLVTVFAATAFVRTGVVVANGTFPPPSLWPCFLGFFTVVAGTYAAQKAPPPMKPKTLRYIVIGLLILSGLSLALPGLTTIL